MKSKILKSALICIIAAFLVVGCSKKDTDKNDGKDNGKPGVSDTAADATEIGEAKPNSGGEGTNAPSGGGSSIGANPELTEEEIKAKYTPTEEEKLLLKEENTKKEIVYAGFKAQGFSTPALVDNINYISATPFFSSAGLLDYIEKNSGSFDFGEGDGSFAGAAAKCTDSFFEDSAILVIEFKDEEGGSGYTVTGAWESTVTVGEDELTKLVFTVKKSAGDTKVGHLLIEVDRDFVSLWDSISVSLYE